MQSCDIYEIFALLVPHFIIIYFNIELDISVRLKYSLFFVSIYYGIGDTFKVVVKKTQNSEVIIFFQTMDLKLLEQNVM